MKYKLILCLALVLSGAILNVLVAWGCILWSPNNHHAQPVDLGTGAFPKEILGPENILGWWFIDSGFGEKSAVLTGNRGDEERFAYFYGDHTPAFYCCGWPLYSIQSVVRFQQEDNGLYLSGWALPWTEIIHRGFQTSKLPAWLHAKGERRLPIVPLWFGFVCNTAIYFFVLLSLGFAWKHFQRRKLILP